MSLETAIRILITSAVSCFGGYFIIEIWHRPFDEAIKFIGTWVVIFLFGLVGCYLADRFLS